MSGYPPFEEDNIGRLYFAKSPDSDIWVSFYDLPSEVCKALWDRIDSSAVKDDFDIPFERKVRQGNLSLEPPVPGTGCARRRATFVAPDPTRAS